MLTWPDRAAVDAAVRRWAAAEAARHPELRRLGYFGSYARGDWGVGSDLDLVAIVDDSNRPFEQRSAEWKTDTLPVPAELLIYTQPEWSRLLAGQGRFARALVADTVWVFPVE